MTEVETEFDSRYDDVDVESILARCQRQGPLFSRKRSIYQGMFMLILILVSVIDSAFTSIYLHPK